MIDRSFFDHINPDGLTPANRVTNAGITFTAVAENIGYNLGFADPAQKMVDDWMASPGHRKNLLDEDNVGYTQTGIGVAQRADGAYFFTQLFLRP
jgi:uncharacterized protein YkwD